MNGLLLRWKLSCRGIPNSGAVRLEKRGGRWGGRQREGFLLYASPYSYYWISSPTLATKSTSSTETSQQIPDSCVQVFTVHVFKACLPCASVNVADEGGPFVGLDDTWSTASMLSDALLTACTLQETDSFLPLGNCSPLGAHSGKQGRPGAEIKSPALGDKSL